MQQTDTQTAIDESPIDMPTGLTFRPNDTNKVLLRAAQKAAAVNVSWPTDTRTVFALLGIMGYRADRSSLDYCLSRKYFQGASKQGGTFVWKEADLVAFADALESIRRWLPMHPIHRHKLLPDELVSHMTEAAQKRAALEAFAEMNPNELVNLMVQCEQQEMRELIAAALKNHLGLLHVKGDEHVPEHSPADAN